MSEQQDYELVKAMSAGDTQACALLYDRYSPALFSVAQKMLKSPQSAEDLVHDVFLEAWKRADSYSPKRGTVRTWLMLRLRSRAIDRIRAPRNKRVSSVEDMMLSDLPEERSEEIDMAPDKAAVRHAVMGLPDAQRVVLELAYFVGLSASEIAARESIPVGTVKSRLAAALRKLRAGLRDPMWSEG